MGERFDLSPTFDTPESLWGSHRHRSFGGGGETCDQPFCDGHSGRFGPNPADSVHTLTLGRYPQTFRKNVQLEIDDVFTTQRVHRINDDRHDDIVILAFYRAPADLARVDLETRHG